MLNSCRGVGLGIVLVDFDEYARVVAHFGS